MTTAPFGPMDPNSQHQIWSRWTFRVAGKEVPLEDVRSNAARWLRKGFGTVGRVRVIREWSDGCLITQIEAEVEGAPAHDPGYVRSVKVGFRRFVEQGWGVTAIYDVDVKVLAGDQQDGAPRSQLVVMPRIKLLPRLHPPEEVDA